DRVAGKLARRGGPADESRCPGNIRGQAGIGHPQQTVELEASPAQQAADALRDARHCYLPARFSFGSCGRGVEIAGPRREANAVRRRAEEKPLRTTPGDVGDQACPRAENGRVAGGRVAGAALEQRFEAAPPRLLACRGEALPLPSDLPLASRRAAEQRPSPS